MTTKTVDNEPLLGFSPDEIVVGSSNHTFPEGVVIGCNAVYHVTRTVP